MHKIIVGRKKEKEKLARICTSGQSEFVAVYGRRRIGKTFLIREYFTYQFDFQIAGLANANTSQQLYNFHTSLSRQSNGKIWEKPKNWLAAFQQLITHIESVADKRKKIIFFDEMPWMDTKGSDFIMAIEHFWNSWASNRKDIVLIACGSAAAWMINNLINHTGGLHNRVTHKLKIEPFTLQETEEMLQQKNAAFSRYQIVELYMALGGIPFYLDAIDPSLSAAQNIQYLFFQQTSLLKNEFANLYRSLFKRHEVYEKVVAILATKKMGFQRTELTKQKGMASGGTLTKVLVDLEESGFIKAYTDLQGKQKNTLYRLTDYYTAFYFQFLEGKQSKGDKDWVNWIDNPAYRAWQGFTFEQVCIDHILPIKKKLGIHGIESQHAAWRGAIENKAAQIDLLIDRRDQVINICEAKFSIDSFTINKTYASQLREKINVFKTATHTKKAVFLTMITTYGVVKNEYANQLVQNEILLDDLFVSN